MEENKQEILNAFFEVLKKCKAMTSLESIEYDPKQEVVFAQFRHAIRVIHVEGKSGFGMIQAVAEHIMGN